MKGCLYIMDINKTLAQEFKLKQEQIDNTVALFDEDKTIPFIARYRKELTDRKSVV